MVNKWVLDLWIFFEDTDSEALLTITGILGGALLSSVWEKYSRSPKVKKKEKQRNQYSGKETLFERVNSNRKFESRNWKQIF